MTPVIRTVLSAAGLVLASTASAQTFDPDATVVLMPYPYTAVTCGTLEEEDLLECESIAGESHPSLMYVYVLLVREGGFPNGVGGFEFGIEYDDTVDVIGWEHCAGGFDIPEEGWPASGTGNAMTWSGGCHFPPGEVAIAGDFVVANPTVGEMRIVPDPRTGRVEWVDCNIDLYEICPANLGTFDLATAVDPLCGDHCGTVPAPVVRWGQIKAVYRVL
jgi:hypothetical protein